VPCASSIACLHGASLPSIKHTASDTCLGKRRARGNCPACTHSGVADGGIRTVFVATIHALLVCSNVKQQQLGTVPPSATCCFDSHNLGDCMRHSLHRQKWRLYLPCSVHVTVCQILGTLCCVSPSANHSRVLDPTQLNCQPHTFSPGSPYNDCTRPGICVARTHFIRGASRARDSPNFSA
jgi:hypothetical protein